MIYRRLQWAYHDCNNRSFVHGVVVSRPYQSFWAWPWMIK